MYPSNELLLNWRGVLALGLGEYDKARGCFFELLDRPDIPAMARPILLNNIAYADALMDREDLHAEADAFSREAMEAMGWSPAMRGTRGTVLVALGQFEEGLVLLRESMTQVTNPMYKAESACLIAEAECGLGNHAAARTYLDEARKLAPQCRLLDRAEAILERESLSRPG